MKTSILLSCAAFALTSACAAPVQLTGARPERSPVAEQLAPIPRFIVLPALDYRPGSERSGRGLERGLMMFAAGGGGLGKSSGAEVLGSEDGMRWSSNPFPGMKVSPSTGVAGDLGASLEETSGRPVEYQAGDADTIAARAPDGTVIVSVVIDHLTKITPRNHEFSQTKHDENRGGTTYEVTTTTTKTETFGAFWVFSFRVQLAQVEGGKIVRRRVRYATSDSATESGYAQAINAATDGIVTTVATTWAARSAPVQTADHQAGALGRPGESSASAE